MPKIKSIKLKNNVIEVDETMSDEMAKIIEQYPHTIGSCFEIEYEKPAVRYWDNGALYDEVELGMPVYLINIITDVDLRKIKYFVEKRKFLTNSNNEFKGKNNATLWFIALENGLVFDDEAKAERWAECLNDKIAIERRLQEINFDNDWVADWSNSYQKKFYISFDHYESILDSACLYGEQSGDFYMCEQAKDWFLTTDEFSERAKKHFLEIID